MKRNIVILLLIVVIILLPIFIFFLIDYRFNFKGKSDGIFFIKKIKDSYSLLEPVSNYPIEIVDNNIKMNYNNGLTIDENGYLNTLISMPLMFDNKSITLKLNKNDFSINNNGELELYLNKGIINTNTGLNVNIDNKTLEFDPQNQIKVKYDKGIINNDNGLSINIDNNTLYFNDNNKLSSFFPNHEFYSNFNVYNFNHLTPINIFENKYFTLRPNGILQIVANIRINAISLNMNDLLNSTAMEFLSVFVIDKTDRKDYFVADNIVYTNKIIINTPYIIKVVRIYKNKTQLSQKVELQFTIVSQQKDIGTIKAQGFKGSEYSIPSVSADFYFTE